MAQFSWSPEHSYTEPNLKMRIYRFLTTRSLTVLNVMHIISHKGWLVSHSNEMSHLQLHPTLFRCFMCLFVLSMRLKDEVYWQVYTPMRKFSSFWAYRVTHIRYTVHTWASFFNAKSYLRSYSTKIPVHIGNVCVCVCVFMCVYMCLYVCVCVCLTWWPIRRILCDDLHVLYKPVNT